MSISVSPFVYEQKDFKFTPYRFRKQNDSDKFEDCQFSIRPTTFPYEMLCHEIRKFVVIHYKGATYSQIVQFNHETKPIWHVD